jgi:AraC-like DNA-binding protein
MLNFIDRWYDKIKPYLFKYKEGFFELPYIGNSPLLIIESFRRMPFIKHDDKKQMIISSSPFVDAHVYYQVLNEDFIVMYSMLVIKANICFKGVTKKEVSHEFYCLTMSTNLDDDVIAKRIIKGERIENASFQLVKPGVSLNTYHFKDSNFQTFSIYFKESWLQAYIEAGNDKSNRLVEFKNSQSECYISSIDNDDFLSNFLTFIKDFFQLDFAQRDSNSMLMQANQFIEYYLNTAFTLPNTKQNFHLSNADRIALQEAERILQLHLTEKFPGIASIAKQIGFSETKLKSSFKLCYQKTMLDYFQEKQMQKAYEMLLESNMKVTEVANYFGYANVGKFSATFHSHMNILPSKVSQINQNRPEAS